MPRLTVGEVAMVEHLPSSWCKHDRTSLVAHPFDRASAYFDVCDFANISTHREVKVIANIVVDETRASWKRAS